MCTTCLGASQPACSSILRWVWQDQRAAPTYRKESMLRCEFCVFFFAFLVTSLVQLLGCHGNSACTVWLLLCAAG